MKKILLILCSLLMIVSFVFVGCKGANTPDNPTELESETPENGDNETPSQGGGMVMLEHSPSQTKKMEQVQVQKIQL